MEPLHYSMERWPDRAFAIRRHYRADAGFREIIADYEDARSALQRWRQEDPPESRRVADYEGIVSELEREIEASLKVP